MLRIDVINGHRLAMIEPDLHNDETSFSDDTLCRWADRRFSSALKERVSTKFVRSKSGLWILAEGK